jgi:hypothetical protein
LIAGDSTRLSARNSRKNNFNQAERDGYIDYIENKLKEFTGELAENDGENR